MGQSISKRQRQKNCSLPCPMSPLPYSEMSLRYETFKTLKDTKDFKTCLVYYKSKRTEVSLLSISKDLCKEPFHQLSSKFMVNILDLYYDSKSYHLVLEKVQSRSLMKEIQMSGKASERTAKFYAAEMLIELENLHKMGSTYGKFGPHHAKLDQNGHLKLRHFNLPEDSSKNTYQLPEEFLGCFKTPQSDFWNLGAFIFQIVEQRPVTFPVKLSSMLSDGCRSLLNWLLQTNPRKRPKDIQQIKSHSFFKNVDFTKLKSSTQRGPILPHYIS